MVEEEEEEEAAVGGRKTLIELPEAEVEGWLEVEAEAVASDIVAK